MSNENFSSRCCMWRKCLPVEGS